jgi:hypothetical protein
MYRYMHEEIGVDEDATSGTLLYQAACALDKVHVKRTRTFSFVYVYNLVTSGSSGKFATSGTLLYQTQTTASYHN